MPMSYDKSRERYTTQILYYVNKNRQTYGTRDAIFALHSIISNTLCKKKRLYCAFIDFKKAFDSIHRPAIWKILKSYGVPDKIIQLIKLFYENYECSIICEKELSEWFNVKTGVRQGCILSPILFLVTIDWVMRQTCNQNNGIPFTHNMNLEDLNDLAEDVKALEVAQKKK